MKTLYTHLQLKKKTKTATKATTLFINKVDAPQKFQNWDTL